MVLKLIPLVALYINFPDKMSNKANMMNHEYRDWILNERTRIVHGQNKVILPRLAAEEAPEHPHPRRSLRKRDEELLSIPIN